MIIVSTINASADDIKIPEAYVVKVQPIIKKVLAKEILAYGSLDEDRQSLYFERDGMIKSLRVKEGASIKKGQVLAKLDTQQLDNEKLQAQENLDYFLLKLNKAKRLSKDNYISDDDIDDRQHEHQIAQLKLQSVIDEIDKHILYSPIDGVILTQEIKYKQPVSSQIPVFIVKNSNTPWVLTAQLTQKEVLLIQPKDKVSINFNALPDKTFPGEVRYIHKLAEHSDTMVKVDIALTRAEQYFYSGMVANVKLTLSNDQASKEKYLVPFKALFDINHLNANIYAVGLAQKAIKIPIIYDSIKDGYAVVLTDLSMYQHVITEGFQSLTENSTIKMY